MTTTSAPIPVEKAKQYTGIRDVETHVGESSPGNKFPGGPYRKPELWAIALIAGPTLWWVRHHLDSGYALPVLAVGLGITLVVVLLLRFLLPHRRPSLSTRAQFIYNTMTAPNVATSEHRQQTQPADGPRIDDSFDPPEKVDGNIVFTKGGVYAEFILDGQPVVMRPFNVHKRAAQLIRNLGRNLPSGAALRGLLVADDQRQIKRNMVGSHIHNKRWIAQCRNWDATIAAPSQAIRSGYTGPVRPRYWLTVPVDAGTAGRTTAGQGKRLWDWVSGKDKDSDTSLHHYRTVARKIAQALPNEFNVTAATPAQIHWHRRHRGSLGVVHEPMPPTGVGPATLTAADFGRLAFDEGNNAHRPWWRPSLRPVVRVYNPDRPEEPASYQTFLTVEHFPATGIDFPRAAYLNALLNVQTEAVIEWTQHLNVRTPDAAKEINKTFLKNINDQDRQRGPRSHYDDELPAKFKGTIEYSKDLANPAERELDIAVVIAVGASSPEILDDAVKQIRQELDTVGIAVGRWRGAQASLWKAFNTGSENTSPIEEFRNPTSAHRWSLFMPLISSRIGNVRGSALAVDQTTMRPSIILHDPEGAARRNKNTGLAVIGDPGGGKSNRTKLSARELVQRGGRAVVFEPDTIAEWAKAFNDIDGVRIIDPTKHDWCFDTLIMFEDPEEAARVSIAHILPWIGVRADSLTAKRYRRYLRPANRARHGITSHRALMEYLRAQPDADKDELLLRLETAEEDFPGFFNDDLDPYRPSDSPATIYLTGNLPLPDAEDIANPHLYDKLSGSQRAAMAMYGLLIDIEQKFMFSRRDRFDVMIFEECAQLLAYPPGARSAHLITRRGRKHATGIWLITQDFRDLAPMGDKFIVQKWIFRVQDPELAYLTLKWAGIDPDMYPDMVTALAEDTSPGNTRETDEGEIEAGAVDPWRRGEGFLIDEFRRAARVQFFGAPTQKQTEALDSTPGLAA
ncbi:ATP-binding protein [Mycobacteroides abscessus]|uniref:ATP-binding protein n=1 Tax=Mycobacteroides abscessus TaxID=36809 RepID=UPI0009C4FA51|nr:ATP-binding protein [Mycobacteroides abscessus]SLF48209.1 Type IV secretory pathway, VirB4 components [Mycobacteroides abscessus subsp. abscessus]